MYLEGYQVILNFFPILNLLILLIIKKEPNFFVGVHKKTVFALRGRGGGRSESYGHVRNYFYFDVFPNCRIQNQKVFKRHFLFAFCQVSIVFYGLRDTDETQWELSYSDIGHLRVYHEKEISLFHRIT